MLKIKAKPIFKAVVNITVAGEDKPATITVFFKHKRLDDLQKWLASRSATSTSDALAEVIDHWQDVGDENGQDLPFSSSALEDFLAEYAAAGGELINAYLAALTESRTKNL